MKLYNNKTYFLNEDKNIVEVEKYVSGDNLLDGNNFGYAWGDNLSDAKNTLNETIDDNTLDAIKAKIAAFMEEKYDIQIDNEGEDEYTTAVYDKETGELEYGSTYHLDKDEAIEETMNYTIGDECGYFTFDAMVEYCKDNDIDISDVIIYNSCRSCIDSNSFCIVYITEENIKNEFGVDDISEVSKEQIDDFFKSCMDYTQAYLDGEEYAFTTYSLNGEQIDSCCGFIGNDTEINGIEANTGYFTDTFLDSYDSIEEFLVENHEFLGIEVQELPSLSDKIEVVEAKAENQEVFDKDIKSKNDLEM